MRRSAGLVCTLALLGAVGLPAAGAAALTPEVWIRLDLAPPAASYAMAYLPPGLPPGAPPAVVFLHGAGSSPAAWQGLLQPLADQLGVVLLLPRAASDAGWGVGPDDRILEQALGELHAHQPVDPARLGLAGHSAGGAYAIEYAYSTRSPFAAVFALAAPYRTVVRLADPTQPPPLRLYYGTLDPNYRIHPLLVQMLEGRGVAVTSEIAEGYGHGSWPATTLGDGLRFLVEQPVPACAPGPTALCLQGGRFRVEASWDTGAAQGAARAVELAEESGTFWFFSPGNLELDVKVLDGCAVNRRFWVYAAGLTDVGVELVVTDTTTGAVRRYASSPGLAFLPIRDSAAFDGCR